ncbi:hypothetical protein KUV89_04410 [Marinobacter hydrocarbonoclasticus]|nr:hypothetical protein [Marinobacter nauticus]
MNLTHLCCLATSPDGISGLAVSNQNHKERTVKRWIISGAWLLCCAPALASDIEFDLSEGITFKEQQQPSGEVTVSFTNLLPKGGYTYTMRRTTAGPKLPNPFTPGAVPLPTHCAALNSENLAFWALEDETNVPEGMVRINKAIEAVVENGEAAQCQVQLANARKMLSNTTHKEQYTLGDDETLTINISREGGTARTLVLKGDPSRIYTHVGFGFIDNRSQAYYSKEITDSEGNTSYEIASQTKRDSFNYSALALFTIPFDTGYRGVEWGPTFGLGATSDSPTLYIGLSTVLKRSVLVSAGLSAAEFDVLKGRYNVGDPLSQAMDSSDLVDQAYKTAFTFTVGFNF